MNNKKQLVFITIILCCVIGFIGCGKSDISNRDIEVTDIEVKVFDIEDKVTVNEIKKGLSKVLSKYDDEDSEIEVLFNHYISGKTNAVSVNINYPKSAPWKTEYDLKSMYEPIYKFSSSYLKNPSVEITISDSSIGTECPIYTFNGTNFVNNADTGKEFTDDGVEQDYTGTPVEIISIDFSDKTDKYVDVDVKILNQSGRDINYIKLDLFYYDKDGNQFRSDWTNDSAVIKDGATQIVSKMTECDFQKVSVEIAEVNYR